MCAQEDTENRKFNHNVAFSRGIKGFIALAAGQQMWTEHNRTGPTRWTSAAPRYPMQSNLAT
jgi:hypothetical protein